MRWAICALAVASLAGTTLPAEAQSMQKFGVLAQLADTTWARSEQNWRYEWVTEGRSLRVVYTVQGRAAKTDTYNLLSDGHLIFNSSTGPMKVTLTASDSWEIAKPDGSKLNCRLTNAQQTLICVEIAGERRFPFQLDRVSLADYQRQIAAPVAVTGPSFRWSSPSAAAKLAPILGLAGRAFAVTRTCGKKTLNYAVIFSPINIGPSGRPSLQKLFVGLEDTTYTGTEHDSYDLDEPDGRLTFTHWSGRASVLAMEQDGTAHGMIDDLDGQKYYRLSVTEGRPHILRYNGKAEASGVKCEESFSEKPRTYFTANADLMADRARQRRAEKRASGSGFLGTLAQVAGGVAGAALTNGSTAGALAGASVFASSDDERNAMLQQADHSLAQEQAQAEQERRQNAEFQGSVRQAIARGEAQRQRTLGGTGSNAFATASKPATPAGAASSTSNAGGFNSGESNQAATRSAYVFCKLSDSAKRRFYYTDIAHIEVGDGNLYPSNQTSPVDQNWASYVRSAGLYSGDRIDIPTCFGNTDRSVAEKILGEDTPTSYEKVHVSYSPSN